MPRLGSRVVTRCLSTTPRDIVAKMPTLDVLNASMKHYSIESFDEKTKIAQRVAERDIPALELAKIMNQHIADFYRENPVVDGVHRKQMMELLLSYVLVWRLQNRREILKVLQESGLWTPPTD